MEAVKITTVKNEMIDVIEEFLQNISNRLIVYYKADLSMVYLHKMVEHLKTFFDDIIAELDEKSTKIRDEIEGLQKEARNLKHALNADFEFCTNEDLPLTVYYEKLDNDLYEMRELYNKRKNKIEECLAEQQKLCAILDQSVRELPLDPLPTESEVRDFELYLVDLKSERLRRENDIGKLKKEIGELCVELELTICDSAIKDYSPTLANLNSLTVELTALQKRRDSIQRECNQMLEKLEVLWDCLDVSMASRKKFRNMAETVSQSSLEHITTELKRCKAIKQQNVKLFVDKLRSQIVDWWNKLQKSEAERNRFTYFHSQVYNEDLLELHEIELMDLKNYYEENRALYEKLEERNSWWEKMVALEAKQNEPGRYNNRGGQLLREEKERKQLNQKLPEIEKEIRKLLEHFEQKYRRSFLINGQSVSDIMEKDWENMHSAKEQLKSARKANIVTPNHRTMATPKTPLSVRNQTASTMKRLASTTNLALANGNTAKKLFLEVPGSGRGNNITSSARHVNVTAFRTPGACGNQTKRNLINQLNSPGQFVKPRVRPCKTVATLAVPRRRSNGITSASKILKKYRRSSNKRLASFSFTDESLNYDTFENRIKTSEFTTNSSVLEAIENKNRIAMTAGTKGSTTNLHMPSTSRILRTPNRNNNTRGNGSPHAVPGSKKLKTTNLGVMI